MALEWTMRLLGELTDNFDSVRVPVKEADRRPGPFPYYGASGIVDYVDDFLFDGEYLLIAEDGENLRTRTTPAAFLARGKFWVNNHAHIVRGNAEADTRFLMYALAASDLSGYLTGSTMPKLTQGNMNRIPLFTPPLCKQRAIAHILGTLDDKIELNRRMNETLEAIARALFKSWFIDFDPVRAKIKGGHYGLPKHLADLFPNTLEESELGKIPKGWEVRSIKDCCIRIQNGGTPRRGDQRFWQNGSIPWLTSGELRQPIITSTEGFITEAGLAESSAKLVDPFSTVVALYGATAGQVSLASTRLTTNQAVCALVPTKHFAFFNYLCMRNAVIALENKAVGSAQQNISKAIVEETPTIFPPSVVLETFSSLVEPFFKKWISNLHESRTIAVLRDTLLPKLILGELQVKDGERFAGKVL